jgi:hypothetical protein
MRFPNRVENRASGLAQPERPPGEEILQQMRDLFAAPGFGLRTHLGFACKNDGRQFALHDELQSNGHEIQRNYLIETTNGWALKGRAEILGGPATNQIASPVKTVARSVGRRMVFDRGIWSICSEILELQETGPAIFAIDQAKNDGHGNQLHC